MAIDQFEFRRVMGHFASGVTVVTSCYEDVCTGITVSSFTSLSLEPALVLFCVDRRSTSHDLLHKAGAFVINILAEDGERLSRLFADHDRKPFSRVAYRLGVVGAPILDDALAVVECHLYNEFPGGDHTIFVGKVVAAEVQRETAPLLYFRSGYRQLE